MSMRRASNRLPGITCLLLAAGAVGAWSPGALAQRGLENLGAHDVIVPEGPVDNSTLYLRTGIQRVAEARQVSRLLAAEAGAPAKNFVIQLDGPITPERRAALTQAGLVLGQYLPVNAFIANFAPGARADAVDALGFVRFASEFDAAWKINPGLGQRPVFTPARQALADRGELRAWVYLFPGEDKTAAAAALAAIPGVAVLAQDDLGDNPLLTVTMPVNAAAAIAQIKAVQFVEEALEAIERNNTSRSIVQSGQTGGTNVMGPTPFYANGITGVGQVGGLQDTKLNINHCSFIDAPNTPGPTHRKILAYNTSSGSSSHGTHTAGTFVGDNGNFTDNMRGVAYGAKLVFNDTPNDSSTGTTFLARLNQHHTQGARVHSNSWGNDGTRNYTGWCRAIDLYSRANEDGVVAFAVSNGSQATTPENAKSCLAVGASQDNASVNNHCSGGTGPTIDQRRKPETYAPGCSTTSASNSTTCGTASSTGTSMACPAVSGATLLVRQYFTDGYYPSGAATPADAMTPTGALLRAMVINSSVDMTGISGYPSNSEGWGRLVADNAAFFPGDTRKLIVHDVRNASPEAFTTTGQTTDYTFTVNGSAEQLRVTMTFTDLAAAINAALAPINDVNLEVVDPNGDSTYLGNVFVGGVSVTGGTADARNSTEQVHITNPIAGEWTVRVRAGAVNQETQGYALVITGDVADQQIVPCPGDTNGDGIVDFADLNTVLAQFGQTGEGLTGDVNDDGAVNFADLNIVLANFGIVC